MLSISTRPQVWKRPAAIAIIDMFTSPASAIAMTTSMRSKRRIWRFSRSLRPTIRRWVSAECR